MSALDKITEEILAQAKAQAGEILDEARRKAAEISEKGKISLEEMVKQGEEKTEAECREIISRARSADRQTRRFALLETRNRIVDEVIGEAKAALTKGRRKKKSDITEKEGIIINNTIDAVFESEAQMLRDRAYEALTSDV